MIRLLSILAVAVALGEVNAAGTPKPNIVFILADDFGYECVRANGGDHRTPHLDALAAGGVRFTHGYAMPLCTPSRVQLMTGRYNCRNYTQFGDFDFKERTFAHALQAAGYATCIAGKWQLGGGPTGPKTAGFDDHCLWHFEGRGSRYADPKLVRNGSTVGKVKGKYGPDIVADHVHDFVSRSKAKPFFVYWPMMLTHGPFEPTPDSPVGAKAGPERFPEMVAYLDKQVGRFVAHLEKEGLRDNTLIVFTGDNGSPKGMASKLDGREVKGDKGNTTTLGTHVPLIASWPGWAKAGAVCGDLIDFTDVLPTLVEAAGAEPPKGVTLDDRSFLPQVRGKKGDPRDAIFCHYQPESAKRKDVKVRYAQDKRWKLYHDGRLFDLVADEPEKNPVPAEKQTAEAAAARTKLQAVLDRMEREVPIKK